MRSDRSLEVVRKLAQEVAEYQGSDQWNLAAKLFAAMAESYRHELVLCAPEELRFRQAAAQQMDALEKFFSGDPNSDPII